VPIDEIDAIQAARDLAALVGALQRVSSAGVRRGRGMPLDGRLEAAFARGTRRVPGGTSDGRRDLGAGARLGALAGDGRSRITSRRTTRPCTTKRRAGLRWSGLSGRRQRRHREAAIGLYSSGDARGRPAAVCVVIGVDRCQRRRPRLIPQVGERCARGRCSSARRPCLFSARLVIGSQPRAGDDCRGCALARTPTAAICCSPSRSSRLASTATDSSGIVGRAPRSSPRHHQHAQVRQRGAHLPIPASSKSAASPSRTRMQAVSRLTRAGIPAAASPAR
jgi:hypothetical protein